MPFLAPLLPMLASAVPFVAPDAPGSHISLTEADVVPAVAWTDDEPIVGTYFFYWYDRESTAHFLNGDGSDALVDHPTDPDDYSWKSADWWERELRDVLDAGIDFIAPVYWGVLRGSAAAGRGMGAPARRGRVATTGRAVLRHEHAAA